MTARAGRLSIVATPIGNLEDITLRALRTLREADLVLAEDTRRTRVLLQQHGLAKQLHAYHAHSSPRDTERVLESLREGQHVALVTDAGTPLISDPGAELVRKAQELGIRVESIPGASAVLTALTLCGLRVDSFRFLGFLPRSGKRRRAALEEIARDRAASVIFESPHRVAATLGDLPAERQVAVCRELTKLHEEVVRGTAAELTERFAEGARGEITLVIEGATEIAAEEVSGEVLDARIVQLLAGGQSVRDVVQTLLGESSLSRQALYARVLVLKENGE